MVNLVRKGISETTKKGGNYVVNNRRKDTKQS